MTPTRLQTRTDIHGVTNGPAHVFGKSNGVDFVRTEFGGAPGWLLTGPRGKVWVPDSAVAALEVTVPHTFGVEPIPDAPPVDEVQQKMLDRILSEAQHTRPAMPLPVACPDCSRGFSGAAALASHRRHKHGG